MHKKIELKEKKELLVQILDKFLRFCKDNNLKCYLIAGTLLGAVRHNGFIPWDDDVDVMMPIDDFNRLMRITQNGKIDERYTISTPENNSLHMWPFIKVCDSKTVLTETGVVDRKHVEQQKKYYGVYIDVFPAYGLPNDEEERKAFQKALSMLHKNDIYAVRVMNRRKTDSYLLYTVRKIAYWFYRIPYRIKGNHYYVSETLRLINKYPLEESKYYGFDIGIVPDCRAHSLTTYLSEETTLKFETLTCPVLKEYDKILSNQYGNYMQLPPENERRIHPSECYWRKD